MRPRALINRYFGEEAFIWFHKAYFADWIMITGLWFISQIISWSPVYQRTFDSSDHLISFSHKLNQISPSVNHFISLLVPSAIFTAVGFSRGSLHIIHHAMIGLWASRFGMYFCATAGADLAKWACTPYNANAETQHRCKWDSVLQSCTGTAKGVLEGRKSFPSGHSSTAFSGMIFLSLWMAGQTGAWCFITSQVPGSIRSSRMVTFGLTLLPIFWAMHVAITRIQDHRHHKEDVIIGSFIGIASAFVFYFMFWPSPFSSCSFEVGTRGQPRLLYIHMPSSPEDFELTQTGSQEGGV